MKKQTIVILIAAVCAMLISSCASGPRGPLYPEAKQTGVLVPKKEKGLVLIYWKPGRMRQLFHVYANDQEITATLRGGTFYSYDAAPGKLRLASTGGTGSVGKDLGAVAVGSAIAGGPLGFILMAPMVYGARKKDRAGLDITPGETTYVEMYNGFAREKMRQVSKEAGEKGMEKCHWLNAPQSTVPQS